MFLFISLIILFTSFSGGSWNDGLVPKGLQPEGTMPPYEDGRLVFDARASSYNVTALTGKQAVLVCVVRNIGNESISWIRHSDTSLLAVNKFIYTTSDRIKVHHQPGTDDWGLSIQPVELRDKGWYSCQVSITPHIEHRIYLNVIQPTTSIIGSKDRYIEEGSTINITCVIEAGPSNHNPSFVFWTYNGKIITYDREKGGTVMISERGKTTTSSLIITHATQSDSGKYECDPSVSYPQSVNVHVIKIGQEAIIDSGGSRLMFIYLTWLTTLFIL
ncbi:carcinoembryonic antigen-related cell adhesion molecule 1 [Eurytemora carolleeae]|uniref:carcinoembryonic antigen-related cell adhesion molecule 1 n=1 Tax=Eurytemora carolleeae TaxID=1294199 RepID=UPI000C79088A|nr:carcinoembryonic antigen-related cell adhesion molecule 1 [Eurytemora carolleeae]|eukprot:XP_023339601.1 carcinoembryonic antigen-related cell adhesion molecule 1-like [Eurytemora affinis]